MSALRVLSVDVDRPAHAATVLPIVVNRPGEYEIKLYSREHVHALGGIPRGSRPLPDGGAVEFVRVGD